MLRVLLILGLIIQGMFAWLFFGFLVYLAVMKVTGLDWRKEWNDSNMSAILIIPLWPLVIAGAVIAGPVLAVVKVIDGIAKKGK